MRISKGILFAPLTAVALALLGTPASGASVRTEASPDSTSTPLVGQVQSSATASLTIAVPVVNAVTAPPYLAQALGYLTPLGVTVQPNTGANTLPLLISGQADLAFFGTGTAIVGAQRGLPMKAIWQTTAGGVGATIAIAASQADTIKSVKDLDGKRIGVLGTSGESYGAANAYVRKAGISASIVPFGGAAAYLAALQNGQISAVVSSYDQLLSPLKAGLIKILVNPAQRGARASLDFNAGASVMGLGPNLSSKRTDVVAFLRALYRAERYIFTHTNAQVADALLKLPAFQGFDRELLIGGLDAVRGFFPWQKQFMISQSDWQKNLQEFVQWNLGGGYSPQAEQFSYANMVDMSYLQAALPTPTTVAAVVNGAGRASVNKRSVLAGPVRIVVQDRSKTSGFSFNKKRVTSKEFVGTRTVTVVLAGGRFPYSSDVRPRPAGTLVATFGSG